MRLNFLMLFIFIAPASDAFAQEGQSSVLNIGDNAPALQLREWIKGNPIQQFEKGNVYVVEFWATWCIPCIKSMPRISSLANQYKSHVTIIGVDIDDRKTISIDKIRSFVDSLGMLMDYHVARQDSNYMVDHWLEASGELKNGIPKTFVVNSDGKLAWIGHPRELSEVLRAVVGNNWDIHQALTKRNANQYLEQLDDSLSFMYFEYLDDVENPQDLGKPDSVLSVIHRIVQKEPRLQYAPKIARSTFSALLKTNPQKAYEYGKIVLRTSTYTDPAYEAIYNSIRWDSTKVKLPAEIYELGADAYQAKMDHFSEYVDVPKYYHKMAECYWRAMSKSKAIEAEQKAIEAIKSKKIFSSTELAAFESQLKQYKNM